MHVRSFVRALTPALSAPLVVVLAFAPELGAQTLLWQRPGAAPLDEFGSAVSSAGDVDGDGLADVLVGAWRSDSGGADSGAVYVCSGRDGTPLRTLAGSAAGDAFGSSLAPAGDVDGDGRADFAVGAPDHDANAANSGCVVVFSGADGTQLAALSGSAGERFGGSLADAGDLDGDGVCELLVGAARNGSGGADRGRAYLVHADGGAPLRTFAGEAAGDWFGVAVAVIGDANGDGIIDVAIGAHRHDRNGTDRGRVYVYSSDSGTLLGAFDGEAAGDWFGFSIAGAGDVDGDGKADLLVGAPLHDGAGTNAGRAYVLSLMHLQPLRTFDGLAAQDQVGYAVASAGDFDGDGTRDAALGAFGNDRAGANAGLVSVRSGRDGSELFALLGAAGGERFGVAVAGAGDVDGNGGPDLIVGASYSNPNGTRSGRAALYRSDFSTQLDPLLAAVNPSRGRFDAATPVVLTGSRLGAGGVPVVRFAAVAATGVVVVDDQTVTCTAPPGLPGSVTVTLTHAFGSASLERAFTFTPGLLVEGTLAPGSTVTFRLLCDPGDAGILLLGVPPEVSLEMPPLANRLAIFPFHLFSFGIAAGSELAEARTVPDDPALSGWSLLFQGAAKGRGRARLGSFTNCVPVTIP